MTHSGAIGNVAQHACGRSHHNDDASDARPDYQHSRKAEGRAGQRDADDDPERAKAIDAIALRVKLRHIH